MKSKATIAIVGAGQILAFGHPGIPRLGLPCSHVYAVLVRAIVRRTGKQVLCQEAHGRPFASVEVVVASADPRHRVRAVTSRCVWRTRSRLLARSLRRGPR